ncbi:Holliday junction resolvase RuvX, partial [Vibrio parahaemolyticus]|uniref:Holliday junction resolvase RuvX n=1 Tax=Vibrio parahaemolyticus TaxID=670 RepID=UPI000470299B
REKKFAKRLQGRYGLPVELHDERLSTSEARAELFSMGGYKALSKGNIDCQSAVVILESWFEALWGE